MITITDLRCEFLSNPLGIDTQQPRFSWLLHDPDRGEGQTAYQILAASSPEILEAGAADVWDSGKVVSGQTLVPYAGRPLTSRQRVYWQVRAWNLQGQAGPYSPPAWFEMGLLNEVDWEAQWIGFPAGRPGLALYVRKTFEVTRPVQRARVYVCGLGLYELRLNGQKADDRVLDPGHTTYSKRVLYATYDVGGLLRQGVNAVGVILGNGWYGGTKLLLQLEIVYQDGSSVHVNSGYRSFDSDWMVTNGPIRENSLYIGEVYDARLERPGWDLPEGDSSVDPAEPWANADVVEGPGGKWAAETLEPIMVVRTLEPVLRSQPGAGVYVFDMGQNFAGWVQLTAQGERGTAITLRFAETLNEDGTVNQENLRAAQATDVYVLKGEGVETWEPCFTYHGFRYVQVEGYPGEPDLRDIRGRVVRSAVEAVGTFECSSDLLNRIHQMVWWTENSNLHAIPTDCPQRDERMGWLNDMGARTEEALSNFGMARLLAKWIADIADTQDVYGAITDTAPYHWGFRPADPVSVCFLMIPWMLYQYYGDRDTMTVHYESMKRWVKYLQRETQDHIHPCSSFGDWAPPIAEGLEGSIGSSALAKNTPGELVSTGFYYYSVRLLAQIAGTVGRMEDETAYRALAREIFNAYNRRFWDETSGGYGSNNQACNVLSLYMGLVPETRRERVLENLICDVVELHDNHLTTGNLCTKYLLEILTAASRADVACAIAMQESYPSWGYMLGNGATTLWERWEHMTGGGMNSHNHPMLGSVDSWFYKALGGITVDPAGPGFERLNVRPHLVGGLTSVAVTLKTVRGEVKVHWERRPDALDLHVVIPTGSRARVSIPKPDDRTPFYIQEGETTVWEDGHLAALQPWLGAVTEEEHAVTLDVGSGTYLFRRVGPSGTSK